MMCQTADKFQSFKFLVLDSLFSRHVTCKVYGWISTDYQCYSVIRIYQLTANYRMELYSYLTLNVYTNISNWSAIFRLTW